MISAVEFTAGRRLGADFWRGRLSPRVTTSWGEAAMKRSSAGAAGLGIELTDQAIAARQRVEAALAEVGPELSGLLVDVCCFEVGLAGAETKAGWPSRSGKVLLQVALQRLARHYGLIPRESAPIAHWGTPDYRPKVSVPEPSTAA